MCGTWGVSGVWGVWLTPISCRSALYTVSFIGKLFLCNDNLIKPVTIARLCCRDQSFWYFMAAYNWCNPLCVILFRDMFRLNRHLFPGIQSSLFIECTVSSKGFLYLYWSPSSAPLFCLWSLISFLFAFIFSQPLGTDTFTGFLGSGFFSSGFFLSFLFPGDPRWSLESLVDFPLCTGLISSFSLTTTAGFSFSFS